ncbi:MAG: SAM-dependent DNA methyltransferase [Methanobrevibacter sp.]|uniref:HsdM family class I SAM-dependent methyltransferase n=1 Tax=Methanobrevibacter sp. TaxID=66852 RepID=UPI0025E6D12E|nr:N-6 DNA methylase [Methanobrevibacter sp.]MBQ6100342.1 SAM-dependent DNA methyltransferase [Methanobrevibacter sp.]
MIGGVIISNDFSKNKKEFDSIYRNAKTIVSIIPFHLTRDKEVGLLKNDGSHNEEYYRQQLIYSLVNSGMYSKDYMGCEIEFPKGNKNSANVKIDIAIFDDKQWVYHYEQWHKINNPDSLNWLTHHLIFVIEVKKENSKNILDVFNNQLKPYMKISDDKNIKGAIYDTGKLFLFKNQDEEIIRYDDILNNVDANNLSERLSLDKFDPYIKFPDFKQIKQKYSQDIENRTVNDLDIISGNNQQLLGDNISSIVKIMDQYSLNNQRGYEILIQMIALKIYDERYSEKYNTSLKFHETNSERKILQFYITEYERSTMDLDDDNIQSFITRMKKLYKDASSEYQHVLKPQSDETIVWNKQEHVAVIGEIVYQLQDYSFIKSDNNDLYQLVFYKFANEFSKKENAQFVTPLDIIKFLTEIINPKTHESIIDPTAGISDFLAISYKYSNKELNDNNLYGVDNDESMVMLSQLNMLLNGDGNANLEKGSSVTEKFSNMNKLVKLNPKLHKNGNWDEWNTQTSLKKFDIVLTNPPFGQKRSYTEKDIGKDNLELYELWNIMKKPKSGTAKIDPGLIFLENAYRILDENGRMGIVLSNSIVGVDNYKFAREWLIDHMRIVALFDLPEGVFADTNVNTSLVIAYKPPIKELEKLKENNYQIFTKKINKVGYDIKIKDRVAHFNYNYKRDENHEYIVDEFTGELVKDEEFTSTIKEFRRWINSQEEELKKVFGG